MEMLRLFELVCLLLTSRYVDYLPRATGQFTSSTLQENTLMLDESNPFNSTSLSNTSIIENHSYKNIFCNWRLSCLEVGEFIMIDDFVYVEPYNRTYNSSSYSIEGNCTWVCPPSFSTHPDYDDEQNDKSGKYSPILSFITATGLGISMLCLVIHLVVFILVAELRNIPGYCMACLCGSLLSGYISFVIGGFLDNDSGNSGSCIAAAFCAHFFLLSSLLWMNTMAYDILKTLLNATGKLRIKSHSFSFKNFYVYCVYAWGIALVFSVAALVVENVEGAPKIFKPSYGKPLCWFNEKKALLVFFAIPVFIICAINVIFFAWSAYTIATNRMKSEDTQSGNLKRKLVIYTRLAVIMGLSWIAGLLASWVDALIFLWYIYIILNAFQGFFIFLAFTCTDKVKKYFRQRFGLVHKKTYTQTLSPTFQSYYSHGNTTESISVIRTTESK